MHIPDAFAGRTRTTRYRHAFAAYERRCRERNEIVFECITSRLRPYINSISPPLNLLDIGIGTGSIAYISHYFTEPMPRLTAIDVEARFFPQAMECLIQHGFCDVRLLVLDMLFVDRHTDLNGAFDITIASNVLYRHADNPELLQKLLSTCKLGGWLVLVHATEDAPWTQVLTDIGNWNRECHGSMRLLKTLDELKWIHTVDRVAYTIDVHDVLQMATASEELSDFILWILPRSTPLSNDTADKVCKSITQHSTDGQLIGDQRDIIIVRRGES